MRINFAESSDTNKSNGSKVIEANLSFRILTEADHVLTATERSLVFKPAVYGYTEALPRTCSIKAEIICWVRALRSFFLEKLVRFMVSAIEEQAQLGTNQTNTFHHWQPLFENLVPRKFIPLFHFRTLEQLSFSDKGGHGIILFKYPKHNILLLIELHRKMLLVVSFIKNWQWHDFGLT